MNKFCEMHFATHMVWHTAGNGCACGQRYMTIKCSLIRLKLGGTTVHTASSLLYWDKAVFILINSIIKLGGSDYLWLYRQLQLKIQEQP
ncbi:MAG: hypothetical protein U0O22_00235 [Acutalibacteraceae bacterium]